MTDHKNMYVEFAETLNELINLENKIYNKRRLVEELRKELIEKNNNGSFGIEFTGHAFKQISERLEEIAMENPVIYKDVFKNDSSSDSLLLPSNLKSFVITLLSDANKKGQFIQEESKSNRNTNGVQYKYTINMKKWSNEKTLQFIVIVEDNYIKTGFFNWT